MDLDLKNKTVFITGASSGIGAAAAQIFSAEGADVVVSYGSNTSGAEGTAAKVRANGRNARARHSTIGIRKSAIIVWPCA